MTVMREEKEEERREERKGELGKLTNRQTGKKRKNER